MSTYYSVDQIHQIVNRLQGMPEDEAIIEIDRLKDSGFAIEYEPVGLFPGTFRVIITRIEYKPATCAAYGHSYIYTAVDEYIVEAECDYCGHSYRQMEGINVSTT